MIASKLLDSSVWIAYFFEGKCREIIDSRELFLISSISIFEIKKFLMKKNVSFEEIEKHLSFLRKRSIIQNIDESIVEKAVGFAIEKNLPAIDALIYATALQNNAELITLDNDFRNLKDVRILT